MVSIIIVNYNKKEYLKKCLECIKGQSFQDVEIIVADNGSNDGSVEMVSLDYPEAKLILNNKNLFLCKACNQGIDASKGDFILCLNNDCFLDKDYIERCVEAMEIDKKIGMVSGKILRVFLSPLPSPQRGEGINNIIDSTGLFLGRNRKPVERGYGKPDKGQYKNPEYIFGVSGACMFLRKEMLLDVKDKYGYFDERFGMYYEDLDLCWRAQKRKWKAYYIPQAIVYHIRGGTAVKDISQGRRGLNLPYIDNALAKMYVINRYRCIIKNDKWRDYLINIFFILSYDLMLMAYISLKICLTTKRSHSIIIKNGG
jgi:GT2 family glycosyltransferase